MHIFQRFDIDHIDWEEYESGIFWGEITTSSEISTNQSEV